MLISEVLHPKQVYFICLHKELLHKTFHSDILHVAYPCLSARHKDTPSPGGGGVGGAAGGGTRPARGICNQISRYPLRGERITNNYRLQKIESKTLRFLRSKINKNLLRIKPPNAERSTEPLPPPGVFRPDAGNRRKGSRPKGICLLEARIGSPLPCHGNRLPKRRST